MKRNVYTFKKNVAADDATLYHNDKPIGHHWPDMDGWKNPNPGRPGRLIYWCVIGHRGFAFTVADAEAIMLDLAKREVERVRQSRKRR